MLYPRIIPCLLVKDKGLVKSVKFNKFKYVGDPINAVKIYNEKEVDEIVVLDIDATKNNASPDYALIQNLANECQMPLCYGGGIKTVEQAQTISGLGVEKVALSSVAVENPDIVSQIAERIGSQSVVVIIDVKKRFLLDKYDVWINNGKKNTKKCPVEFAKQMEEAGAGEIVINSIDNDGVMKGYDFSIVDRIREETNLPITVLGGAGSLEDIGELVQRYGIIGAAAGSLFVFKGIYKAVLINYPSPAEKEKLIMDNMNR